MGASAEGAEITTFLAPPVKWAEALSKADVRDDTMKVARGEHYLSMVVKTP